MNLQNLQNEPKTKWNCIKPINLKTLKGLNYEEEDWVKNIVVAHKRLIVIHQFDINFQIQLTNMEIMKLKTSGVKRKYFTCHYNMGDEFILVMGGKDSTTLSIIGDCIKFNVNTLEWVRMPNLNQPRVEAGSFMCREKKYMYIFGGSHDSVEMIDLHNADASWQQLDVDFPIQLAFKGGLTMLPMWFYNQELETINSDCVLIFGGGIRDVYSFNPQSKKVEAVLSEDRSDPDSPGENHNLQILRDDWFIAQPVIFENNLVLMGMNHIYFLDLVQSKSQIRKLKGKNYIEGGMITLRYNL